MTAPRRFRSGLGRFLILAVVCCGCAGLSGDDYRGGILRDPGGEVVQMTYELVPPDDARAAGARQGESKSTVGDGVVTLSRRASVCSRQPDVLIEVKDETLVVRLVLPSAGEPCLNDESHVVTLELKQEFDSYKIG